MKLITRIHNISIWSDQSHYVVRTHGSPTQKMKHAHNAYFLSLDHCFQEVFDIMLRQNLMAGEEKTIAEILTIVRATHDDMVSVMRPFLDMKAIIKGRALPGDPGKDLRNAEHGSFYHPENP